VKVVRKQRKKTPDYVMRSCALASSIVELEAIVTHRVLLRNAFPVIW